MPNHSPGYPNLPPKDNYYPGMEPKRPRKLLEHWRIFLLLGLFILVVILAVSHVLGAIMYREVYRGFGPYGVYTSSFSPDGNYIVSFDNRQQAVVWSVKTGKLLTLKRNSTLNPVFSADSQSIINSVAYYNRIELWDPLSGQITQTVNLPGTYDYENLYFNYNEKTIQLTAQDMKLYDNRTGQLIKTFAKVIPLLNAKVSFSQDDKFIVTTNVTNSVNLWNVETGQSSTIFTSHTNLIDDVEFSPDNKYIITASQDKTVEILAAQTGHLIRTINGHTLPIMSASFSPDNQYIVTASQDATAKIWDAKSGLLLHTLTGHTKAINHASFSFDSKYVVTASDDETSRIWNSNTGQQLQIFQEDPIYQLPGWLRQILGP